MKKNAAPGRRMRRTCSKASRNGKSTGSHSPLCASTALNKRQPKYLQAIDDQDQENERYEKGQWSRGGRPRPATVTGGWAESRVPMLVLFQLPPSKRDMIDGQP